jgi:hypothetical protein
MVQFYLFVYRVELGSLDDPRSTPIKRTNMRHWYETRKIQILFTNSDIETRMVWSVFPWGARRRNSPQARSKHRWKLFYTQWIDGISQQFFHFNPPSATHGVKVGAWCAMSAATVNGYISFPRPHSHTDATHFVTPLYKTHAHLRQSTCVFSKNTVQQHSKISMPCLENVFGDRIIRRRQWPLSSPDWICATVYL